jgi:hypothetical protein
VSPTRAIPAVLLLALGLAPLARADLKAALAERDLGKRSKLALVNANAALKTARDAANRGDTARLKDAAAEIRDSVDLAYDSLESTGKDPRKSPKWFKNAEIQTRELLKKMETLQQDLGFQDRPLLDPLKARLQQVHDELLMGLMEGKKK